MIRPLLCWELHHATKLYELTNNNDNRVKYPALIVATKQESEGAVPAHTTVLGRGLIRQHM